MNNNSEKIYVYKENYEMLESLEKEIDDFKNSDFAIKICIENDLYSSSNNEKIEIFSEDFTSISMYSIKFNEKNYSINNQQFNKIQKLVQDNLDTLINCSKNQTNSYLEDNAFEGEGCKDIIIKYGQLIITIIGTDPNIENLCDKFINELKTIINED